MWFRKRKHADLATEVARLVKELQSQNDALEDLSEKLEANIKRNEAEIRGLELQLSKKHEFIEKLFASMLEKQITAPAVVPVAEKKSDSNMVDLNSLDTVTQAYIKKKLDEKKANGATKKLP